MSDQRPGVRRDADRSDVDAIVRAALESSVPAPTVALLARIGGRSPRVLADAAAAVVARRVALAATVVFGALSFAGRDATHEDAVVSGTESSLFAWIVPAESELEARAPGETLVAELFATEVPE
ncbi:MAG: hypothetical protein IPH13_09485 [Planctomycetes bacterium]|nr:hypothetical protein [Planctomycetota bacterium]MCC7170533.1 hypothetical protein [Planctomycetota bacterium]